MGSMIQEISGRFCVLLTGMGSLILSLHQIQLTVIIRKSSWRVWAHLREFLFFIWIWRSFWVLPLVGGARGGTPPNLPYKGRSQKSTEPISMAKIFIQKIFLSNEDIWLSEVNHMVSERNLSDISLTRSLFHDLEALSHSMLESRRGLFWTGWFNFLIFSKDLISISFLILFLIS